MARRTQRMIRPAPRTSVWISMSIAQAAVAAATTATVLASYNAAALALRPFTIIRSRLSFSIISDQAAATEFVAGNFGMITATDAAVSAGVNSLPSPQTDADSDWFVYQLFFNALIFGGAADTEYELSGSGSVWHVDSKAMRKVGAAEDMVVMVDGLGANGYNIAVEGRQLVKLH